MMMKFEVFAAGRVSQKKDGAEAVEKSPIQQTSSGVSEGEVTKDVITCNLQQEHRGTEDNIKAFQREIPMT